MNPLLRTVYQTIEHSPGIQFQGENKKAFQLVKYVTGKRDSLHTDYEVITSQHRGYDSITIKGRRGFIRVTLTPLFEVIGE